MESMILRHHHPLMRQSINRGNSRALSTSFGIPSIFLSRSTAAPIRHSRLASNSNGPLSSCPTRFKINPVLSNHHSQIRAHRTLASALAVSSHNNSNLFNPSPYVLPSSQQNHIRCLSSWNEGGGKRPPSTPKRVGPVLGLATSAFVFLGKGKSILTALKLTKFASLGSMLFSIGTYSMFFGLPYAAGMVGLVLVHETGHALVMKNLGLPFSPMVFVPFVGAAVSMKETPKNAYDEALVAFGGPVLGSIGAGAVALGAQATNSQLLFALADFGFMINLFNMLPLGMLDGGRITGAISPYAGLVGLGMGGTMIYYDAISNPIFYLVMMAGGYQTFMRIYNPHAGTSLPPNYYRITPAQKMAVTGGYFGVVGALLMAMSWNEQFKKSPETLQRERAWGLQ